MSVKALQYHQLFSRVARVMTGVCAAIPLWGAYDLLLRHGMPMLDWGMAPFLAMGLIALSFGLMIAAIAVFGGSRTVTIDRASRMLHVDYAGNFGLHRRFTHPFVTLEPAQAIEDTSGDGPSTWLVRMMGPKKPLEVMTYREEALAKAEAEAINAYMHGRR